MTNLTPDLFPARLGPCTLQWRTVAACPYPIVEGLAFLAYGTAVDEPWACLFFPPALLGNLELRTPAAVRGFSHEWDGFWSCLEKPGAPETVHLQILSVRQSSRSRFDFLISSHRRWGLAQGPRGHFLISLTQESSQRLGRRAFPPEAAPPAPAAPPSALICWAIARPWDDPLAALLVPALVRHPEFEFHALPLSWSWPRRKPPGPGAADTADGEPAYEGGPEALSFQWARPGSSDAGLRMRVELSSGRRLGDGLRNIVLFVLDSHFRAGSDLIPEGRWKSSPSQTAESDDFPLRLTCRLTIQKAVLDLEIQLNRRLLSHWAQRLAPGLELDSIPALWASLRESLPPPAPPETEEAPTAAAFLSRLDETDFRGVLRSFLFSANAPSEIRPPSKLFSWVESATGSGPKRILKDPAFQEARWKAALPQGRRFGRRVRLEDRAGFVRLQEIFFEAMEMALERDLLVLGEAGRRSFDRLWLSARQRVLNADRERWTRPEVISAALGLDALVVEGLFHRLGDTEWAIVLIDCADERWRRFVTKSREERIRGEREFCRLLRSRGELKPARITQSLRLFAVELGGLLTEEQKKALGLLPG